MNYSHVQEELGRYEAMLPRIQSQVIDNIPEVRVQALQLLSLANNGPNSCLKICLQRLKQLAAMTPVDLLTQRLIVDLRLETIILNVGHVPSQLEQKFYKLQVALTLENPKKSPGCAVYQFSIIFTKLFIRHSILSKHGTKSCMYLPDFGPPHSILCDHHFETQLLFFFSFHLVCTIFETLPVFYIIRFIVALIHFSYVQELKKPIIIGVQIFCFKIYIQKFQ